MKGREGGENTWSAFSSKLVEVTLFSRDEDFDTLQYSSTSRNKKYLTIMDYLLFAVVVG